LAQLLITGGAGFIGSHTCVVLLEAGHNLVVLDNFSNSSGEALRRVRALAHCGDPARLIVVEGDIRQSDDLNRAFTAAPGGRAMDAVIHFAGLKAVGESVEQPLRYWDVNVAGSRELLAAMAAHGCHTIAFSSSATLYGYPEQVPIHENASVQPVNPYGHTKAAVEQLLADVGNADPSWRIARLRYFNPVGAHPSGQIGEDPRGRPNNLFPFISQVAVGRRHELQIFGGDWPTPDGTCVRDYIHVMDLAEGHRAAIEHLLDPATAPTLLTLNLGSGQGYSVLEVVAAFERSCGHSIRRRIVERRAGDAAITVADPQAARRHLGWTTRRDLDQMCRDGWAWQQANPQGYPP